MKNKLKILDITYIAVFVALITVCSWLSIPFTVPITLQTFAIFLCLSLLGGQKGTVAILVYILLGLVGVPVFSGFRGGLSVIVGVTGGYIVGFLLTGIIYWVFEKLFKEKLLVKIISLLLGLIVCYSFGTAWFIFVSASKGNAMTVLGTLSICVFPFIIPDTLKLAAALLISKRLKPLLKK